MTMVKYVQHQAFGFVLFSSLTGPTHKEMAAALSTLRPGRVLSAGFVIWANGRPHCGGVSESLGVESQPGDSVALAAQMGLPPAPAPLQAALVRAPVSSGGQGAQP